MMNVEETLTMTPALQSCLRCRRIVSRREQHDAVEERVLETIRAEHPEWADAGEGERESQLRHYRELLEMRKRRSARARVERLRERVRRYRLRARLMRVVSGRWRG